MSYIPKNAQEEALKEIAKQMSIANSINCLRELHNAGTISPKEFIEKMEYLLRIA